MLELTGGHVTIRNLTFELSRLGLLLGCCHAGDVLRPSEGGYLIEGNTFRNSGNSIRGLLSSPDSTIIHANKFSNVFHALSAQVSHFHVLNNEITVPEPARIPGTGHPGFAIGIAGRPPGSAGAEAPADNLCAHNVISGNRIDGHPDGILVLAGQQGGCRHNIIRDNTIAVRRVRYPVPWPLAALLPLTNEADSTFVGVPVGLLKGTAMSGATAGQLQAVIEDNLVEGNRILGAEGLGIEILRASRNRIVNNTISRISRRDPFPGNTLGATQEWREANGSGIWVSPGSTANQIAGNTFEGIASHAIVLEGDSNHVEIRSASDSVHNPGSGNRVTRRDGGTEADATSSRRLPRTRPPSESRNRHGMLLDAALETALRCEISCYDALYIALTEALSGTLVTADRELGHAVARVAIRGVRSSDRASALPSRKAGRVS
jgi:parallel beta-helix repeat protein